MPKRILLADDSITIQKVVELTFSDGDYEVTAVNNGAKAIAKLAEMRPDVILSDIIMPEKNGYEVCEYVKSHPEYRTIPVILLTGTFEPFDPDRAEKAGCDAVVTKPFESQSLIHKVEELVAQAQSAAPVTAPQTAAPPAPATWQAPAPEPPPAAPAWQPAPPPAPAPPTPPPAASPWLDDQASPFSTSGGSFPTPPEAFTHDAGIFGAATPPQATTEMPFEPSADPFGAPPAAEEFSGETRAFTKVSMEDLRRMAAEPAQPAPPAPEPPPAASPWDEGPAFGGETRAFGRLSFDELQALAGQQVAPPSAAPAPEPESPFGAPPGAEEFTSETRVFTKMSFDDIQRAATTPPSSAPETVTPWGAPPAAPAPPSAETQAFPPIDLGAAPPAPAPPAEPEQPLWQSQGGDVDFGGETRMFPRFSLDLDQKPPAGGLTAPPETNPWDAPQEPIAPPSAPEPPAPAAFEAPAPSFAEPGPAPTPFFADALAAAEQTAEPDPPSPFEAAAPEPERAPAPAFDEPPAFTEPPAPAFEEPAFQEPPAPAFEEPASAFMEPPAPAFAEPPAPEFAAPHAPAFAEPEPAPMAAPIEEFRSPEPAFAEAPGAESAQSAHAAAEAEAAPAEPAVPAFAAAAPPLPISAKAGDLTDEQIERIARRVVELMSDQIVRNIAWEVIPDLAEMVVKERIRQLESEA